MCGIVGYVGKRVAAPLLLAGLKGLEYRGYDSAGIALNYNSKIVLRREVGNLSYLEKALQQEELVGSVGLGHTRWATHGAPILKNTHPHQGCDNQFAVVHNGIIENYQELKKDLIRQGHQFSSDTDSEVVPHLLEKYYQGSLTQALLKAAADLKGSYALGVMARANGSEIACVRSGSPLIIGLGEGENFLASDIPALLPYTKKIIVLEDGDTALIKENEVMIYNQDNQMIKREVNNIDWDLEMVEKKGFKHFMLKEIYEQPDSLRRILQGRIQDQQAFLKELKPLTKQKGFNKIFIVACGTAYHAALIGKRLLIDQARIPVEVELASEFRYQNPLIDEHSLLIVVSQSGETADTLAALRYSKAKQAVSIAFCNVKQSSIEREADYSVLLKAGPEIAVASTKAYFNMLAAFYLFTDFFVRRMQLSQTKVNFISELVKIPLLTEQVLKESVDCCKKAAKYLKQHQHIYFVGRGIDYDLALEGALKLKEISYIHCEAYAAGEMKHGTLALIEQDVPVLALFSQENLFAKMISNVQEIKARGGYIIAIAPAKLASKLQHEVDQLIIIPDAFFTVSALLMALPLQLVAYYTALELNCPIDQPRNLAKSVTVE